MKPSGAVAPSTAGRWARRGKLDGATIASAPLLLGALGACTPTAREPSEPQAQAGVLDLRTWRPDDGPVALRGRWAFRWNALLPPNELRSLPALGEIEVPCRWSVAKPGPSERHGLGAATYALRVLLPDRAGYLGLQVPEPNLATRVWVNGELLGERGTPGLSVEAERGATGGFIASVPPADGVLEIVVQQSNHSSRTGGLGDAPVLGRPAQLWQTRSQLLAFTTMIFGLLLGVALYHPGIYSLSTSSDAH